ncbi:MAG: rod-binding protein [Rhizobiaceae bacterium]
MAFDFGSDILTDAIRAANPAKVEAVRVRLENFSKSAATSGHTPFKEVYETELDQSQPVGRVDKRAALEKYEAAVLGTFIEAMMPKETESVYGTGFSGEVWKSQLSRAVADQLAHHGGIGIASRLLKDFTTIDDKIEPLSGVNDASAAVDRNSSADAATSFLHKMQLNMLIHGAGAEGNNRVLVPTTHG